MQKRHRPISQSSLSLFDRLPTTREEVEARPALGGILGGGDSSL